ncbi:MAG: hypothetical protein WDN28_28215 [Chthoniobacter sp.]
MPQPAERKDDEPIDDFSGHPETASPEWNVNVIANHVLSRDMPALPEFLKIFGKVGPAEVFRQGDAKHPREPDGNIAVALKSSKMRKAMAAKRSQRVPSDWWVKVGP